MRPGLTLLEDELRPAKMLLDLWMIRQENENTEIILDIDDRFKRVKVVSIVILMLLENIIKHGNLSDAQHPEILRIRVEDSQIMVRSTTLINT